MRNWKIRAGDPHSLILAADARLAKLNYANDHIWELLPGSGEPAAIVLQTTYGLRARSIRLFPQFSESHQTVANPADFENPLEIAYFSPNYLELRLEPLPDIEVTLEYWVPDGQTVAGRIRITNTSELNRKIGLDLSVVLNPNSEGRTMTPRKKEAASVLQGQTENLAPVLFITGGAEGVASPYPSLTHELDLAPGQYRRFTWVLASLEDDNDSFRHARLTAAQNWDAAVAEIKMRQSHNLEVFTGNKDWDAALAFSQKAAINLLYPPSEHLPNHSLVSTRLPDQGYSSQSNGADYHHLWNGQTPLESWYLSQILLPGYPEYAKGLLRNFISKQQEDGFIDHKPGLGGQNSSLLAMPVLVSLAWDIYQYTEDLGFLKEVFRPLLNFIQIWFSESNDRDGDGVPEWSNLVQTGYDENPIFSRWQPWAQGSDITLFENPDLCAYLYREIKHLRKISVLLGQDGSYAYLDALSDTLRTALQTSWNGRRGSFQYWDRETHQTNKGEILKQQTGPGGMLLDLVFELPTRLELRLECDEGAFPQVEVSVHGRLNSGQHIVETIPPTKLLWHQGISTYTFPTLFAEIEHLHFRGLPKDGTATLRIVDNYEEDHTMLTPLWANIPIPDQVEKMLRFKIEKETFYNHPYGMPAYPKPPAAEAEDACLSVWLPWNMMTVQGLLAYGYRTKAAELFGKLLDTVSGNLKREGAFRATYHADDGRGIGQRNHIIGLLPTTIFLETLGIRPISPWKVYIENLNPFPEPVTIRYMGLTITSSAEEVQVKFPDGESSTLSTEIPCQVEHPLADKVNQDGEE